MTRSPRALAAALLLEARVTPAIEAASLLTEAARALDPDPHDRRPTPEPRPATAEPLTATAEAAALRTLRSDGRPYTAANADELAALGALSRIGYASQGGHDAIPLWRLTAAGRAALDEFGPAEGHYDPLRMHLHGVIETHARAARAFSRIDPTPGATPAGPTLAERARHAREELTRWNGVDDSLEPNPGPAMVLLAEIARGEHS